VKETDTEITGIASIRDYNKDRGTGMIYFGPEDYARIKSYLEGKDLIYRMNKEKIEICIKEQQYPD
jgi:hypothetical protein